MQNIKLIASDLDGTLLLDGRDTLKKETLSLIRKITEKGIVFAVASGRQYENLRELFSEISDDIAYICYNGGLCVYKGETIYENYMERDLALSIAKEIELDEKSRAMISIQAAELIRSGDESFLSYMHDFVKAKTRVIDSFETVKENVFKVALYNEDEQLNAHFWKEKYRGVCEVLTSGNVWLDFIPYFSDKGTALRILAEHLGISRESVLAFGDNDNDIEMLRYAGIPVTMCSAREEIQKHGKFSTPSVDDVLKTLLQESAHFI